MVRTYLADITPLYDEGLYRKYYDQLPKVRQEKADRIMSRQGKAQSVGAWILLQTAAGTKDEWRERVYNLSHSGDYVLCSVSDSHEKEIKVGCDIERLGELRMKVARRFYTSQEYDSILQKKEEERKMLFYRYWVLKESFMKATRMGMKLDMKSFEILFDEKDQPFLGRQPEEFKETYVYKEYRWEGVDAAIAVCVSGSTPQEAVHMIPFE